MSDDPKSKTFPDVSAKLSALPKKSLFERQKAEAEAKRARERAETAAVYEDFVKSFEDDSAGPGRNTADGRPPNRFGNRAPGSGGGPAKRHFTGSGQRMSGPGTLGPPPPSLSRKRAHDGFQPLHRNRDSPQGILGFDSAGAGPLPAASAFRTSDDEDEGAADTKEAERAAAKPTLYLASLPPGTSPSVVKSLIPSTLGVDNVKILRPPNQPTTDRKSVSAIVTLVNESAASDIDSAVSTLQSRYLGWGYYLSISRHLSSAAISSTMPVTTGLSSTLPFGAKTVAPEGGRLNRAPPPAPHRGGFAPPASYGPSYGRSGPPTQVEVKAPSDLKQLRLIHKALENLLKYGPEFEALLMSRPEVQRDEKWAWLWDARSAGGVYYRWKLWETLTNSHYRTRRGAGRSAISIFEDGPNWFPPEAKIKFEYVTRIDEFVSDEDYDSSDEDMSDMEDERRHHSGAPPADGLGTNEGLGYMNPLQKAKLVHLLARLPTTHAKLRKGDVARVTAFAIEHAGAGAEEVVELIVLNILEPFAYSGANPQHEREKGITRSEQVGDGAPESTTGQNRSASKENLDTSAAKLVGLYLISDILSSSATSGVRHAWRYRQLFESALKAHHVFEHLGRLEKDFGWGRLRAEKWKRSVGTLLHLWEGWCVFPQSSQEHFFQVFEKPPLTEEELREEKEKAEADRAASAFSKSKSRWKTVDEDSTTSKFGPFKSAEADRSRMDIDQGPAVSGGYGDLDGEPMSDIDGEPMEDSDLEDAPDGEPMEEEPPLQEDVGQQGQPEKQPEPPAPSEPQRPVRKPRPKAEDMFADSDSE
ncbi:coatamer subunit protein [Aspergillus ambiguus]|uniref:coatamer subunit protein n=1 Tax=Aspergillus ambiguus TaxID=176160 RepID=UPI003CCD2887